MVARCTWLLAVEAKEDETKEEDKEDKEDMEDPEKTNIKSNNPHLTGGSKKKLQNLLLSCHPNNFGVKKAAQH